MNRTWEIEAAIQEMTELHDLMRDAGAWRSNSSVVHSVRDLIAEHQELERVAKALMDEMVCSPNSTYPIDSPKVRDLNRIVSRVRNEICAVSGCGLPAKEETFVISKVNDKVCKMLMRVCPEHKNLAEKPSGPISMSSTLLCANEGCRKPLPENWISVYCSNTCAADDA